MSLFCWVVDLTPILCILPIALAGHEPTARVPLPPPLDEHTLHHTPDEIVPVVHPF